MKPFRRLTGIAAPLPRTDVDTDQIIPKQFLKGVTRSGYGRHLFHDWRRAPDADFVLDRPEYRGACILLTGANFGCGSSREHAVWALRDFGIRAVVAPSFADIFRSNCLRNGVLPVALDGAVVARLTADVTDHPGRALTVDLERQVVDDGRGFRVTFEVDPFRKRCLLEGLDDIDLTLAHEDRIRTWEDARARAWPA